MPSQISFISTDKAPEPRGHYSQATVCQGLIHVATQLPIPPGVSAGEIPDSPGSIAVQARQVLENVLSIVTAAGGSADSLLRITIYVSDVTHWPAVNEVYEEILGECRPARGVIPTGKLHLGYDVAADAVAVVQ